MQQLCWLQYNNSKLSITSHISLARQARAVVRSFAYDGDGAMEKFRPPKFERPETIKEGRQERIKCPSCQGHGYVRGQKCSTCRGTGVKTVGK